MNKFGVMLGHSYVSKLKSKSFIITSIIMLIGVLILGNMNRIIDLFSGGDSKEKNCRSRSNRFSISIFSKTIYK